jgi:hypothetical protein
MFSKVCTNLNQVLKLNKRINSKMSGSTGVLVLVNGTKIVSANVGDSRAILLVKNRQGNLEAMAITNDHTPDIEAEKERIVRSGGDVKPFRCKFRPFLGCSNNVLVPNGKFIGPKRVWKKGKDTPGLMMTRTFGDEFGHKCGVTHLPGMP